MSDRLKDKIEDRRLRIADRRKMIEDEGRIEEEIHKTED